VLLQIASKAAETLKALYELSKNDLSTNECFPSVMVNIACFYCNIIMGKKSLEQMVIIQ